jgi:hypothetical protein
VDANERQLQKLKLIIAEFQQKLANADLTIADQSADLQLLRAEAAQNEGRIAELEAAVPAKKGS